MSGRNALLLALFLGVMAFPVPSRAQDPPDDDEVAAPAAQDEVDEADADEADADEADADEADADEADADEADADEADADEADADEADADEADADEADADEADADEEAGAAPPASAPSAEQSVSALPPPPPPPPPPPSTEPGHECGTSGWVKWFDDTKGYGYIARPEGADVFVHASAIAGGGIRTLNEGAAVCFDVVDGPKGPQARNVETR
jgi:cold shock CspA family protein